MIRTRTRLGAAAIAALCLAGCFTMRTTVGDGGKGATVIEQREWYFLFGLVPLNPVDGSKLVGDAKNYTVKSSHTFLDFLINLGTGIVTVESMTVTVTK